MAELAARPGSDWTADIHIFRGLMEDLMGASRQLSNNDLFLSHLPLSMNKAAASSISTAAQSGCPTANLAFTQITFHNANHEVPKSHGDD